MGILDTLVVGFDASAASKTALAWAADRVTEAGTVHVVTALSGDRTAKEIPPDLAADLNQSSDRCEARTENHVVAGDPAEEILRVAAETKADAIIVGPHSKPYNLGTLGQVTRRLLRRATVPIVVARAPVEPEPSQTDEVWPVLACVGYGDATERAALWAADYASARAKPLLLLHVVGYRPMFPADSPSDMLASYLGGDVLRQWAKDDLDDIRSRIKERNADLKTEVAVEVGFASREILAAGDRAELVVLGKRQGSAALRSFISPRIHHLIVKSAATVVVLPSCFAAT